MWRRQLKPRLILRTSALEAARPLVAAGAGIAVPPDFLYRPWALDAVPTTGVGLVWRSGLGLKAAAEFIALAREQSRLRRV